MLKIKDNVDLKELEKFGFKIKYSTNTGEIDYCRFENHTHLRNHWFEVNIDIDTRKLEIRSYSNASFGNSHTDIEEYIEEVLYDLIKADMVEKVEE